MNAADRDETLPTLTASVLRRRLEATLARRAGGASDAALLRAGMAVAFIHHDPELTLVLDGRGEAVRVYWDTSSLKPDLAFEMGGDTVHAFWSGGLNVMGAITGKQLTARGNLLKALALLPSFPETQAAYREVVAEE